MACIVYVKVFGQCNTWFNKKPVVTATLPSGPSIETGMSDRTSFEHAIGHALRSTPAVQHVTREFGTRIYKALVEPHAAGPVFDGLTALPPSADGGGGKGSNCVWSKCSQYAVGARSRCTASAHGHSRLCAVSVQPGHEQEHANTGSGH